MGNERITRRKKSVARLLREKKDRVGIKLSASGGKKTKRRLSKTDED